MRNSISLSALLVLVFGASTIFSAITATADARGRGYSNDRPYVVARSRFGNGTVVGPVRRTRLGYQVRTPGGNWLHCAGSCAETLRVQTVDFWENDGAGQEARQDNPAGLFGDLKWIFRY